MTHTAVLVIQSGHTALDMVRERINAFGKDDKYDEIIKYLEAVGK